MIPEQVVLNPGGFCFKDSDIVVILGSDVDLDKLKAVKWNRAPPCYRPVPNGHPPHNGKRDSQRLNDEQRQVVTQPRSHLAWRAPAEDAGLTHRITYTRAEGYPPTESLPSPLL
jgi:hypothetical protein